MPPLTWSLLLTLLPLSLSSPDLDQDTDRNTDRRRLQHRPDVSWTTGESLETSKGGVPAVSCPLGKFRELGELAIVSWCLGWGVCEGCVTW